MIWIMSAPADEGGPLAYAKSLLLNRNLVLESLTAVSKSASACYVQIFDSPRKLAVAITDTDSTSGLITAPAHGFETGDKIVLSAGITGLPNAFYFLQKVDANSFYVNITRADALNSVAGEPPDTDNLTGTFDLFSNNASAPVAEEYPLSAAASPPTNMLSYTNARFKRGLYVRAVTAQDGSTLIGADDVKFTPRYRTGPIAKAVSYED
jgi:hypothetical protein